MGEDGVGIWGALVVDKSTSYKAVHWGTVPDVLISSWRKLAGEQVICQIEAYAALAVRYQYRHTWTGRKTIIFIDSERARHTLIKGSSPSATMLMLAQVFNIVDLEFPTACWFDRVASASNIADLPSRGKHAEAAKMIGAELAGDIVLPDNLMPQLTELQGIPISLLASTSD